MLEARIVAFERARILVQNNFPLSNAILFGSNAIGLALPASDVDILLVGFQCISRNDSAELLNQVGYLFSCMGWAINYEIYANAKVPVLKL
jgi:DNA polymerase sigma